MVDKQRHAPPEAPVKDSYLGEEPSLAPVAQHPAQSPDRISAVAAATAYVEGVRSGAEPRPGRS